MGFSAVYQTWNSPWNCLKKDNWHYWEELPPSFVTIPDTTKQPTTPTEAGVFLRSHVHFSLNSLGHIKFEFKSTVLELLT